MLRIRTPQHTKSVTCDRNSKANPYKWKFINYKETGNQEPARTDSSHKDQLPMIRNKEGQRGKLVSTVEHKPSHSKSECPAKKAKYFKCGKESHYGSGNLHHKSTRLTARLIPVQVVTFCHCTRLKHSLERT